MKKENNNIYQLILHNKKVNNYTKMMIMLNTLNYYEDYYIPNKKLGNMLNVSNNNVRRLLHQLENDNIIKVFYKGRKRYFTFIGKYIDTKDDINYDILDSNKPSLFDYNWLEEEE